uniref:Nuclear receptor domain-containing protein n=1 Tax=Panagrellus redivivus TaxID=6233 RepID=A0A7E4WCF7_PANRE
METVTCAVCNDSKSTGRHYGVNCCLGCKSFFRRAVVRKRVYFCERSNDCDVSERSGRQSCRACRLRKCFAAGMTQAALHRCRDHFGHRSDDAEPALSSKATSVVFKAPEAIEKPESMLDVYLNLHRRVRANLFYKLRVHDEAKRLSVANGVIENRAANTEYYADGFRIVSMADMSTVTSEECFAMLEWAKNLPDFAALPDLLRPKLLRKFAIYHIVLESCYHTSKSGRDNVWLMPNDSCFPRDVELLPVDKLKAVTAERIWRQEKLYKTMTARCIDEVPVPMRIMGISEEEFIVLKLIMLFDRQHSDDKSINDQLINSQSRAITALFEHYHRYPVKNCWDAAVC